MNQYMKILAFCAIGLMAAPAAAQYVTENSPLNGGDRVANQADALGAAQVQTLLREAEQAARQGRLPLANELVERAEVLVLTRSTIAGTEDTPVRDGAVAKLADARAALVRRDVPTATQLMAEAAGLARVEGM